MFRKSILQTFKIVCKLAALQKSTVCATAKKKRHEAAQPTTTVDPTTTLFRSVRTAISAASDEVFKAQIGRVVARGAIADEKAAGR